MASDPFSASVLAEENAVEGSPAMAFVFHEAIAAGSIYAHTNDPLPSYTLTADGPAVSVCHNDDGACAIFSDFVLSDGLLDSFSIDGQSIEQWTSMYERVTTVETLTIDGIFAVRRPSDGVLSVGLLFGLSGGDDVRLGAGDVRRRAWSFLRDRRSGERVPGVRLATVVRCRAT